MMLETAEAEPGQGSNPVHCASDDEVKKRRSHVMHNALSASCAGKARSDIQAKLGLPFLDLRIQRDAKRSQTQKPNST